MNHELLTEIGLTDSQAKAYTALIEASRLTPPQLSERTGENRTNSYMLLDKLVELGLAKKLKDQSKATYRAENPAALEELVKRHRQEALLREETVKHAMPQLLSYFYAHSEQPGVRFFQGKEGLLEIYDDILMTGETLYLIRGVTDKDILDSKNVQRFIETRIEKGIEVKAITPDVVDASRDPELDKKWLFDRTWVSQSVYSEPVEIDIYGDKVAFISFGREAIGVIIESPQIAASMRKLFHLMQKGAKLSRIQSSSSKKAP